MFGVERSVVYPTFIFTSVLEPIVYVLVGMVTFTFLASRS